MTYNGIMRTTDVRVQYDGASGFAVSTGDKSRPSVDSKGVDFVVAVEEKRTV